MTTADTLQQAAMSAPEKDDTQAHLGTVATLRGKGYSWRDIAAFMAEHGVSIDHARLYRAYTRHLAGVINVPSSKQYVEGLKAIKMSAQQRAMLEYHYRASNRTVTYTELATAVGKTDHQVANKLYGNLGAELGKKIGFEFPMAPKRGKPFYSGSIGIDAPRGPSNEYRLMMHHELAKAIVELKLFD
ncbi:MAG: hypothetical protein IPO59_15025 [Betaproteobacteria bacterium]|jgi:hypothetical protein|nr:hypothetical protein [Betaproteobacteria bacterium]